MAVYVSPTYSPPAGVPGFTQRDASTSFSSSSRLETSFHARMWHGVMDGKRGPRRRFTVYHNCPSLDTGRPALIRHYGFKQSSASQHIKCGNGGRQLTRDCASHAISMTRSDSVVVFCHSDVRVILFGLSHPFGERRQTHQIPIVGPAPIVTATPRSFVIS